MTDSEGTTNYTYDPFGQLTTETRGGRTQRDGSRTQRDGSLGATWGRTFFGATWGRKPLGDVRLSNKSGN